MQNVKGTKYNVSIFLTESQVIFLRNVGVVYYSEEVDDAGDEDVAGEFAGEHEDGR